MSLCALMHDIVENILFDIFSIFDENRWNCQLRFRWPFESLVRDILSFYVNHGDGKFWPCRGFYESLHLFNSIGSSILIPCLVAKVMWYYWQVLLVNSRRLVRCLVRKCKTLTDWLTRFLTGRHISLQKKHVIYVSVKVIPNHLRNADRNRACQINKNYISESLGIYFIY